MIGDELELDVCHTGVRREGGRNAERVISVVGYVRMGICDRDHGCLVGLNIFEVVERLGGRVVAGHNREHWVLSGMP